MNGRLHDAETLGSATKNAPISRFLEKQAAFAQRWHEPSATFAIMAAIFHPAMAWDTVSHDGWRFEISTPFGHKKHNYQVVYKEDGHPVRFGRKSERFEVRPGDCGTTENGGWNDCENDRERTEMSSHKNHMLYNGDESWYRWSIFFPKNYETVHPVHMTFGQFKQVGCHPSFTFNVIGHRLANVVVHAKWSNSNSGWFKVWHNGKQKMNYKGKTMWCHEGIYFKYGVYRTGVSIITETKRPTTIVYYDGIRVSKSDEGMFDPLPE